MNFAWRKWKLGVAVSVFLSLLVAGSGLSAGMQWRAFVAVLCTAMLTHLGTFLKDHPVDAISFGDDTKPNPDPNMKTKILPLFLTLAMAAVGAAVIATGCMTQRVQKIDPATGFTNTVTVVNEVNLSLDCEGIKLAACGTVIAVGKVTKGDEKVLMALADAHTTLDGILHGINSATSQDVLDMLKNSGNAQLAKEAQSFAMTVSNIEQKYLQGVSATVRGEITTKITQAIDDGLAMGLNL